MHVLEGEPCLSSCVSTASYCCYCWLCLPRYVLRGCNGKQFICANVGLFCATFRTRSEKRSPVPVRQSNRETKLWANAAMHELNMFALRAILRDRARGKATPVLYSGIRAHLRVRIGRRSFSLSFFFNSYVYSCVTLQSFYQSSDRYFNFTLPNRKIRTS